ncbi:hypothetical protein BJ741DRAFT_145294 [Chytriomyces cf. hyalinus JEL632]|nr:hypothetical protein BJ741DRAFT_145294 [Chytriomyces cf. hyalinus JEL632]
MRKNPPSEGGLTGTTAAAVATGSIGIKLGRGFKASGPFMDPRRLTGLNDSGVNSLRPACSCPRVRLLMLTRRCMLDCGSSNKFMLVFLGFCGGSTVMGRSMALEPGEGMLLPLVRRESVGSWVKLARCDVSASFLRFKLDRADSKDSAGILLMAAGMFPLNTSTPPPVSLWKEEERRNSATEMTPMPGMLCSSEGASGLIVLGCETGPVI